ncbi:protein translocase component YidC [Rhizocola hellebori]|uniref:Membrane protein insertase YidC n=1 Tax=Rhizocola hellebori TaxID=1392758 RepID=A0A8J3QCS4_9ACTN|nr:membrane protein insertase YidC [Rhizocola hellebori]GIH07652.1 protein translocase component YidC [Rhizocola hellebori]
MPFDFLAVPANYLVAGLASLTHLPVAAAIVIATGLVRLVLVPVGVAQHKADKRRNALLAKMAALRERYVNSPKRLETELGDLYRTEGGAMFRGCLPMLVPMPVFAALYQLFVSPTVGGGANLLMQQTMFGVPLGAHLLGATGPQVIVFVLLLVTLAAIGYLSSRLLQAPGAKPHPLLKILPYLTTVFAIFVPLAASLYLVTTTAWTVAQTVALRHWLG